MTTRSMQDRWFHKETYNGPRETSFREYDTKTDPTKEQERWREYETEYYEKTELGIWR